VVHNKRRRTWVIVAIALRRPRGNRHNISDISRSGAVGALWPCESDHADARDELWSWLEATLGLVGGGDRAVVRKPLDGMAQMACLLPEARLDGFDHEIADHLAADDA
jgi:hypothetical protein